MNLGFLSKCVILTYRLNLKSCWYSKMFLGCFYNNRKSNLKQAENTKVILIE